MNRSQPWLAAVDDGSRVDSTCAFWDRLYPLREGEDAEQVGSGSKSAGWEGVHGERHEEGDGEGGKPVGVDLVHAAAAPDNPADNGTLDDDASHKHGDLSHEIVQPIVTGDAVRFSRGLFDTPLALLLFAPLAATTAFHGRECTRLM